MRVSDIDGECRLSGRWEAAVTSRNARGERVHDLGIEVRARAAVQLVEGLGRGPREPVGAVRGHRIEGVHHRDDAGLARDPVAAEAVRETRTRPAARDGSARCAAPWATRSGRAPGSSRPRAVCSLTCSNSAGVSGPGLFRMSSRVPILPMSCSSRAESDVLEELAHVAEVHRGLLRRIGPPATSARWCTRPWPRGRAPASARR